ncbi:hypothetical protein [Zhihengliuella alba]|uniref:hypothetical protein n=1 Tax=Zhihengliuella alba TaxID=547018 RepID=UPI0031EA29A9
MAGALLWLVAGLVLGAAVFYVGNWGYSTLFGASAGAGAGALLGALLVLLAVLATALLAARSRAAALGLLLCLVALAVAGVLPRLLGLPLAFSGLGPLPGFAELLDSTRMSPVTFLLIGLAGGLLIPRRDRGRRAE